MPIDLTRDQLDLHEVLAGAWSGMTPGTDVWRPVREMGLTEIPFPEELGGAGGDLKDAAVVLTWLGRTLTRAPYLSSVIMSGLTILHGADDATRRRVLPALASGERTAALVCRGDLISSEITCETDDSGRLVLTGVQHAVMDGATADDLVVIASGPDGPELAWVDGTAEGLTRTAVEGLDLTREFARVEFTGVRAERISGPDLPARLAEVRSRILIAMAVEQVGLARTCLELTVDFANQREQFGRVIGSFQAIKHRLVDMLVAIELAEATVLDASDPGPRDPADLAATAASSRVLASRAAMFAAEEAIQIHGGIGFTWEHPLHHYFRRAKSDQLLFDDDPAHLDTVAEAMFAAGHAG